MITFLFSMAFAAAAVEPDVPTDCEARLILEEKAVLKAASEDPTQFYLNLRKVALETRQKNGDFKYDIAEPVVRRMILDLTKRLSETLHPQDRRRFLKLIGDGQGVLERGPLYRETFRFTFAYLEALDAAFLRLHPDFASRFHRTNARAAYQSLVKKGPDLFMYPSFMPLGVRHFVRSRSSPFHVVGLHPEGLREGETLPFADGFYMRPSEFAWHDIGHIEFMDMRDAEYLRNTFKPIERVVQEWDFTRRRIVGFWDSYKGNKDVYDAIGLLLFEILHERGYQFSLALLKSQLDTPKWTEILLRKLHNNYFEKFPGLNFRLFDHLEEGRAALLKFVDDARKKDQLAHIRALYGEDLAVRVTHFPKVEYGQGMFGHIEILDFDDVRVVIQGRARELPLPIAENFILAQVNPTVSSPFTPSAIAQINAILANKKQLGVAKVVVGADRQIFVEMLNGEIRSPDLLEIPQTRLSAKSKLEERHFFELNQILGAQERGERLSFTLVFAAQVFKGTIRQVLHEGVDSIVVQDKERGDVTLPLSEALVDPLQKQDF